VSKYDADEMRRFLDLREREGADHLSRDQLQALVDFEETPASVREALLLDLELLDLAADTRPPPLTARETRSLSGQGLLDAPSVRERQSPLQRLIAAVRSALDRPGAH
jgi:hypothetical protein